LIVPGITIRLETLSPPWNADTLMESAGRQALNLAWPSRCRTSIAGSAFCYT
jgi:hypothetical protein